MSAQQTGDVTEREFFAAVKAADLPTVERMARETPRLLAAFDPEYFGAPPLNIAVSRGNPALVQTLLSAGADPDLKSDWWAGGFAALHALPAEMRDELSPLLLEAGATVDAHAAAWLGDAERLEGLVDANPKVLSERGGDGRMPLHFAATPRVATLLIARGADLEARDIDHESTPAMWAARDHPEVARVLLEAGAQGDIFLYAAIGDVDGVARVLDEHPDAGTWIIDEGRYPTEGENVQCIYAFTLGWKATPLHVAARCNQPDVIRALVDRGVDIAIRGDHDDATPLHIAAWDGCVDAAHALVHSGAPIDVASGSMHDNEPLGWACVSGQPRIVRLLLAHGAPVHDHHRKQARAGVEGEFLKWSRSSLDDWRQIADMLSETTEQ